MRDAVAALKEHGVTVSGFVQGALERELKRVEKKHGGPFPPRGDTSLYGRPRGKPAP